MPKSTDLYSKATAPATTGEATLVPDSDLQPPLQRSTKVRIAFTHMDYQTHLSSKLAA